MQTGIIQLSLIAMSMGVLGVPMSVMAQPAPAAPLKPLLYHATIRSIDGARTLTVSGVDPTPDHVALTPRARVLRGGKTALLNDFKPHDAVVLRARPDGAGKLTASLVEDEESEKLALLERRAPALNVKSVDNAGVVVLEGAGGVVQIRIAKSRLRIGRREMGAPADLEVGQSYLVRMITGPDGEPAAVLTSTSTARAPRRKASNAQASAPDDGRGSP